MSYIKKEVGHLLNSFKFKRHIFVGIVYDIILLVFFAGACIILWKSVLNLAFSRSFLGFYLLPGEARASFIVSLILFFFVMTGVYSFLKFLIWNNLLRRRFHTKSFVKYYFVNLFLFFVLVSLQVCAVIFLGSIITAVILGIVFHHFNIFFKMHYARHRSVRKAFFLSLEKGLSIHEFIFVYVVIAVLAYIYIFALEAFESEVLFVLSPVFVLLMLFWLRHYFKVRHEF